MKHVLIIVEGIADQVFIADFIAERYQSLISVRREESKKMLITTFEKEGDINGKIIKSGGLEHLFVGDAIGVINQYYADYETDAVILCILDSDAVSIKERKKWLVQKFQENKVDFPEHAFFLFPNDTDEKLQASKGDLESLLVQLFAEKYKPVETCIDGYLSCLEQTTELTQIPTNKWDLKAKVYGYLAALLEMHKKRDNKENKTIDYANEGNRDYRQPFWNLYAEATTPLKEFLDRHFGL